MNVLARACAERAFEPVDPYSFYRDIFCDGAFLDVAREKGTWAERDLSDPNRYCGIMQAIPNGELIGRPQSADQGPVIRRMITADFDTIDEMQWIYAETHFCVTSPIAYAGCRRTGENARYLYALAIDLDGLTRENGRQAGLDRLLTRFDKGALPRPTYIVASGNGLHLYYALDEPIPMWRNMAESAQALKTELTLKLWSRGITNLYRKSDIQIGSIFQGFRMPGSRTKSGDLVEAFRVGDKVSREYLNSFVGPDAQIPKTPTYSQGQHTREETAALFPVGNPETTNDAANHWKCHFGLYQWWLKRIRDEARPGHRYFCLMYLAVYARKCGVPVDDLERDAMELLPSLAAMGASPRNQKPFTERDARGALRAYDDVKLQSTNVDIISVKTGITITRNKRNGRKQTDHLKAARARLAELNERGDAISGRPNARDVIAEWRAANPGSRKIDCIRDTGLSKPTVYKWWADAADEPASSDAGSIVAGPGAPRFAQRAGNSRNSQRRKAKRRPERDRHAPRLQDAEDAASCSRAQTLGAESATSG